MSAVKVSKDAYSELTSMTPAERAASGGSGAIVLGLRLPDDVPFLQHILGAMQNGALPNYASTESMRRNFANAVALLTLAM